MPESNTTQQTPDTQYDYYYNYPYYDEFLQLQNFIEKIFIPSSVYWGIVYKTFRPQSPLVLGTTGFGTGSNLMNLVVFSRQGIFADSYTLTLSVLALCDVITCTCEFLFGVVTAIAFGDAKNQPGAMFEENSEYWLTSEAMSIFQVANVISTCVILILSEFIGWVTAYLALERMTSVAFPFHVKAVFSPRRSCIVFVILFLFLFLVQSPRVIDMKLVWMEMPGTNGSLSYLNVVNAKIIQEDVINNLTLLNKSILRTIYIILIIACNAIVAIKVKTSQDFRKARTMTLTSTSTSTSTSIHTNTAKPSRDTQNTIILSDREGDNNCKVDAEIPANDTISTKCLVDPKTKRELRLIRIMYIISVTFLITRIPESLVMIFFQVQWGISEYWGTRGYYTNQSFYNTLENVGRYLVLLNGAANIFIYYTLSTKYRELVKGLFTRRTRLRCNK